MQSAIDARLRAARLAPTEPKNYIALAEIYDLKGEPERGLEYAQKAVDVYPTGGRGLAVLGRLQAKAGLEEEADATYRHLLGLLDTPVGRYEAVPELPDVDYVWAWHHLGVRAFDGGRSAEGRQMIYEALDLLNRRLGGEQLTIDMLAKLGGRPSRQIQRLSEMTDRIEQTVARHPDAINKMRLAEARGRLRERSRQEALLLDIIDYSRARDEPYASLLGAAAYLELGEMYALGGEEKLSGQAYAEGLRLLEQLPEETVISAGEVEGRRPLSVERLSRLKEAAQNLHD